MKDFILFLKTSEGRWILQVPHWQQGKLRLGINYEDNSYDPMPDSAEAARILNTAKDYFDKIAKSIKDRK